jgi:hypothetical protein
VYYIVNFVLQFLEWSLVGIVDALVLYFFFKLSTKLMAWNFVSMVFVFLGWGKITLFPIADAVCVIEKMLKWTLPENVDCLERFKK